MKYHIITVDYDASKGIILYLRGEDYKKKAIIVGGFRPYFFVQEDSEIPERYNKYVVSVDYGYKGLFGENLKAIVVTQPTDVRKMRDSFEKHYEAAIRFKRRFLIDTGLCSGVEIPENKQAFNYTELKPVDFHIKPLYAYIDIEIDSGERFAPPDRADYPIIIATLYNDRDKRYITVALSNTYKKEKWSDNHIVVYVKTEKDLIEFVIKYLKKIQPDTLEGWNVHYDIDYLKNRAKKLGLDFDLSGICVFDLLKAYAKVAGKYSNRLKDVVVDEELADSSELVSDEWKAELWRKDKKKAILYNKKDVEYLILIDEKYRLTDFFWGLKSFVGLEDLETALFHSVIIDTLILRFAYNRDKSKRRVLPSQGSFEGEGRYKGAIVFQPTQGVYENVAVFDMSRYYPSIIMAWGLSPEKKDGILVEVCRYLNSYRDRFDQRLKEIAEKYGVDSEEYKTVKSRRDQVKYLLNAVYGYTGFSKSRIYRKHLAETVTRIAREGISFIQFIAEKKLGRKVIYGDTDSIMIQVKSVEEIPKLEKILNLALKKFCEKHGVRPLLKLKFEKLFKKVLFTELKSGGAGAKKRYAGWVILEGNMKTDYIYIKGFEIIRRDSSKLTRIAQKIVFENGLRGNKNKLIAELSKLLQSVRNGKFSLEDIAIRKTLGKPLHQYKVNTDFVRGCKYAERYLGLRFFAGDIVKMIYVKQVKDKPQTDVICFFDSDKLPEIIVDIDVMIDKTIVKKVSNILRVLNITFPFVSKSKPLKQKTILEVLRK